MQYQIFPQSSLKIDKRRNGKKEKTDHFSVRDGIFSGCLMSNKNLSNFLFFLSFLIYLYEEIKQDKWIMEKIDVFFVLLAEICGYPESVLNIS